MLMNLHYVNPEFLMYICKYPLKYSVCAYRAFVLNRSNTILTSDIKYCIVSVTSSRTCRRADIAPSILRLHIVDSEMNTSWMHFFPTHFSLQVALDEKEGVLESLQQLNLEKNTTRQICFPSFSSKVSFLNSRNDNQSVLSKYLFALNVRLF